MTSGSREVSCRLLVGACSAPGAFTRTAGQLAARGALGPDLADVAVCAVGGAKRGPLRALEVAKGRSSGPAVPIKWEGGWSKPGGR